MIIAGGAYHEECQLPPETDFFGSGVRAAAAIQTLTSGQNQLHTCIGSADADKLRTYADTFNFKTHTTKIPTTVTFDYLHNHSKPRISPNEARSHDIKLLGVDGDAVLRFGLVEGSATVAGDRVVYDPQSNDPDQFQANGSTANKLAVVLNQGEAERLTGETNIETILTKLISEGPGADAAIVKRGARGAIVRTPGKTTPIPVFQTSSVWGIGSGDVFTAVFAAQWAENGLPPEEAALIASKATAYYCKYQHVPIPSDLDQTKISAAETNFTSPNVAKPTIYLAAPFFDIGERYLVEEVKSILESEGVNVFSPVDDVGRAADYSEPEEVASKDREAIENADLVFALLDHPDTGTHFELGYARRAGIPVTGYAHDPRMGDDTMLTGSGCEIYGDLSSAVYNAIWEAYA